MKANRKKNLITAAVAVVVLTLCVLSVVFSKFELSQNQADTLKLLLIVCGCAAAYCFIVGELADNYSQMDKLWSILPIA